MKNGRQLKKLKKRDGTTTTTAKKNKAENIAREIVVDTEHKKQRQQSQSIEVLEVSGEHNVGQGGSPQTVATQSRLMRTIAGESENNNSVV